MFEKLRHYKGSNNEEYTVGFLIKNKLNFTKQINIYVYIKVSRNMWAI